MIPGFNHPKQQRLLNMCHKDRRVMYDGLLADRVRLKSILNVKIIKRVEIKNYIIQVDTVVI